MGASLIKGLLASTGWGAWLIKSPLSGAVDKFDELLVNYLTNKGLIVINIGAIYVNGEWDQSSFDKAMDEGIAKAKVPGLNDAQKKVIDDEVLKSFRRFARITKP